MVPVHLARFRSQLASTGVQLPLLVKPHSLPSMKMSHLTYGNDPTCFATSSHKLWYKAAKICINMQYETRGCKQQTGKIVMIGKEDLVYFLQLSRSSTQSSWKHQSPHQKIWAAARAHKQKMPVEAVPGHNNLRVSIFSLFLCLLAFKHLLPLLHQTSKTRCILEG